ncbi:MAG: hypothetical protein A3A28_03955 [Candidatus Sungbacteria bacterium RIFCSPLOWO2_01_FULL_47_32]|uniref:Uncharacterized protein n=1 Tax=Candidatus Sungbacteria bacterium RIFCSPHIGHO2_01_FULL_47_32 TaxID=1802264 RepID=A0A1G2K1U3_9BACT|nr:MAG: hypothetical protein A2633_01625 [Candidatus Sungbacteria bacterium RIFCSPHIGHO2_01_FULL_47_32]OHA05062.1 MAG: hypothetical protein A3A28_03955 [Candidatus Sungbacteria bacterium RIFCSPLOWO2_01_FULL_47_32]
MNEKETDLSKSGEEFRHARAKDRGRPRRHARQSRATQKSFLFLLEEKSVAHKIRKAENIFCGTRERSERWWGDSFVIGILLEVSPNFLV